MPLRDEKRAHHFRHRFNTATVICVAILLASVLACCEKGRINDPAVVEIWEEWQAALDEPGPHIIERLAYVVEYKWVIRTEGTPSSTEVQLVDDMMVHAERQ